MIITIILFLKIFVKTLDTLLQCSIIVHMVEMFLITAPREQGLERKMKTADISINVTMQREWVCEKYTKWAYTARVVSNELGEVLGTFSAGNLAKAIRQAVDKANQYINDEAINVALKRDDCGSVTRNDVWCQIDVFDYAKAQRIADNLLAK